MTCHVHVPLQLAAPDNLEQQFKALEGDSVDDELAAMKSGRLKSGNGSKAQLPEGRPYDQVFKKDAIDEVRPALQGMFSRPGCDRCCNYGGTTSFDLTASCTSTGVGPVAASCPRVSGICAEGCDHRPRRTWGW